MSTHQTQPHVVEVLDDGIETLFAIIDADEYVGHIRLHNEGDQHRLTAHVVETRRGQGVGSAAVAAVCALARERADVGRLIAAVPVADGASQRVLEKNGFVCHDVGERPLHFVLELVDHQ